MRDLKAIIFDMDGTLFDSEGNKFVAWNYVLGKYNVVITEKEYALEFAGRDTKEIFEILKSTRKLPELDFQKDVVEPKEAFFMEGIRKQGSKYMPFAEEMINFCKENSIRMAIATGGHREEVEFKLADKKINDLFEAVITKNDVTNKKPHAETYLKAIEKLGINHDEAIAIEDSRSGMLSAKAANLFTIAVPSQYTRIQNFSEADSIMKSLDEVKIFIEQLLKKQL